MRGRPLARALALTAALCCAGCTTLVTREAIRTSGAPAEEAERVVALWEEAVGLANAFLASDDCLTLPHGRYDWGPDGSLYFIEPARTWRVAIRNDFGGNLVTLSGFRAQERADGFVVGSRRPRDHPAIDNSMFRRTDGEWHDADSVASLLLHETTHTWWGEGTVGYWNTLLYYGEVLFTWRTNDHSAERRPHAIDWEYAYWRERGRLLEAGDEQLLAALERHVAEHLATDHRNCRHGLE